MKHAQLFIALAGLVLSVVALVQAIETYQDVRRTELEIRCRLEAARR